MPIISLKSISVCINSSGFLPLYALVAVTVVVVPLVVADFHSFLTLLNQFAMKAKKFLMIGFLMATLAVSGFAAYQYATASSSSTDCCVPGCCEGSEMPECCTTGN